MTTTMPFVRAAAFAAALCLISLSVAQAAESPPQRVIVKWRAQADGALRLSVSQQAIGNVDATETCTIATPQAGIYYVMLQGYQAFSGITLLGSFANPQAQWH